MRVQPITFSTAIDRIARTRDVDDCKRQGRARGAKDGGDMLAQIAWVGVGRDKLPFEDDRFSRDHLRRRKCQHSDITVKEVIPIKARGERLVSDFCCGHIFQTVSRSHFPTAST